MIGFNNLLILNYIILLLNIFICMNLNNSTQSSNADHSYKTFLKDELKIPSEISKLLNIIRIDKPNLYDIATKLLDQSNQTQ